MPAPLYFDVATMIDELAADEKTVLTVYDDATGLPIRPGSHVIGHPTIGTGRALDVKGLLQSEAHLLIANDVAQYVRELGQFSWWSLLDPIRQRAVMNMRHQLGLHGLLAFKDMIAGLTAQDWPQAHRAALNSDWARDQTPARAARIANVLLTGIGATPWP